MLLTCMGRCRSDGSKAAFYQDRRYGPGIRVFNKTKVDKVTPPAARCTVCGTKRSIGCSGGVGR